ncbi:MAG TPA: DUF2069 domain-containing protein [Xanthomonadaceae bacterium]|nr:DUF2069 domain-containing protein [Xanthomonadaceae bacterium]
MATDTSVRVLVGALLALGVLFVAWFVDDPRPAVAVSVFALPPLLLAVARWRGHRKAAFWAGVLALGWFSHGVMVAWTRPAERGFALTEIALALAVVVASSWPGLRARSARL